MKKDKFNIAIIGATGLVGRTFLKVLEERDFPAERIGLFASERSAGMTLLFRGEELKVQALDENSFDNMDIALFSAGKSISLQYAPVAAAKKCFVIDNSSAWRMIEDVPLVVPEVNPDALRDHKYIIANPNCSTIQLVAALKPIEEAYKLKKIIVSTYQSISGAGQKGVKQLMSELEGREPGVRVSSHKVAFNAIFHQISDPSGYSEEEIKMINETHKIMDLPSLPVSVTCVRLPILGGHGESVIVETEKPFELDGIREVLTRSENIIVVDDPQNEKYPTPSMSEDTDQVYVGRIRRDNSAENALCLWIVADNLRKGAATNAVQIAEKLVEMGLVGN